MTDADDDDSTPRRVSPPIPKASVGSSLRDPRFWSADTLKNSLVSDCFRTSLFTGAVSCAMVLGHRYRITRSLAKSGIDYATFAFLFTFSVSSVQCRAKRDREARRALDRRDFRDLLSK